MKQTTLLSQAGAVRIPATRVSVMLPFTETNGVESLVAECSVEIPFATPAGNYKGTIRFGSLNGGRVGVPIRLLVGDTHLDLMAFAYFDDFMSGPMATPIPTLPTTLDACLRVFNFDRDGDVDLRDFAQGQNAFTGP